MMTPPRRTSGCRVRSREPRPGASGRPWLVALRSLQGSAQDGQEGPLSRASRLLQRLRGGYASTSSRVLCATTSPLVIFGGFGRAVSSFSRRTHSAATRVDSSASAAVAKNPTELNTPSPAWIR